MSSTTTSTIPTVSTRTWTAVLFDLDGTIIDSAHSITAALKATFAELGLPIPSAEELLSYVGPPLLDTLKAKAGLNDEEARAALTTYRAIYARDLTDAAVFPGVVGLLERLHKAGMPIALATSKPETAARVILEHFKLAHLFTSIAGASDDESRSAKSDIVARALEQLSEAEVDTSRSVMVGDRAYDVIGAGAHGVPTIMVEWGYGSPSEAGDAIGTVHSVDQLCKKLLA